MIAAIVLAAGMSRRMGRLKPLLPFGDKTMLSRVLETLSLPPISPLIVVTGHAEQEILPVIADYKPVVAHNLNYADGGMLSSVQTGVRALPAGCDAFLLALGDQPMVQPATVQALIEVWQRTYSPLVLPTFEGKRGHPILFDARLGAEILALPSDATLKHIVTRHADAAGLVPVSDPSILADVDTPEDYERTLQLWMNAR